MAPSWPAPRNSGLCSICLPAPRAEAVGGWRVQKGQGVAGRDLPSSAHPAAPRGAGPAGRELSVGPSPPARGAVEGPARRARSFFSFSPLLPPQRALPRTWLCPLRQPRRGAFRPLRVLPISWCQGPVGHFPAFSLVDICSHSSGQDLHATHTVSPLSRTAGPPRVPKLSALSGLTPASRPSSAGSAGSTEPC